jgi:hypothetical protein
MMAGYGSTMPHGFYTIEQWKPVRSGAKPEWLAVAHVEGMGGTVTEALLVLEKGGQPGLFRVVQTQRTVWAEIVDGKLKLRKHHCSSPENLARLAKAFERDGGKWPVTTRGKRAGTKK